MATIVPTLENESLEDFLKSLEKALIKFMSSIYPVPHMSEGDCECPCCKYEQPWRIDSESTTGDKAVIEAKFDSGCEYTQVEFTRDLTNGEFTFTNPTKVREVCTYVPIEEVSSPPLGIGLSVAGLNTSIALESIPVSQGSEELQTGKPVQLLREGAIFDILTGKFLMNVTAELCSDIANSAKKLQLPLPIDFGHALFNSQVKGEANDKIALFGRVMELEARPGEGLWGTPGWTPTGVELIKNNPGVMYLSPTLMPAPFDPMDGAQMPGMWIHSVSLTPSPRQNELTPVSLSQKVTEVPAPAEEVKVPVSSPIDTPVVEEKAVELSILMTQLDEGKLKLEALSLANTQLASEVEALRAEKLSNDYDALFSKHSARGVVLSAVLKDSLKSIGIEKATVILDNMNGDRPTVALGHGRITEPETQASREFRIIELAKTKNISLAMAAKELV